MPHQTRAEETRARILSAAKICFSRSGYDAASVSDICTEAGVTKGAFYYHFETKQVLFLELLNDWLGQFDTQLAITRNREKNVSDSLIDLAGATHVIFDDSASYLPVFLEFWLHSIRDPLIWQNTIEPYRRYMKLFSLLMEEGRAEGSIQTDDPALGSRALIALAIGMILQGLMDPQGADWGEQIQESVKMLLKGMRPGN